MQQSLSATKIAGQTATFQVLFANNTGGSITPTLQTEYAGSKDNWGSPVVDLSAIPMQLCANAASCTDAYTLAASASGINGYEEVVDFGNNFSSAGKAVTIGAGFDFRASPGVTIGLNAAPPVPEIRDPASTYTWDAQFYVSTFPNGVLPVQSGGVAGCIIYTNVAETGHYLWQFPTLMRATPSTVTTYNPSASNNKWRDLTAGADLTATIDPNSAISARGVEIQSQASGSVGDDLCIQGTADATISGG